jgi:hypothetical protein
MQIKINGKDVTLMLKPNSLTIIDRINSRSMASIKLVDKNGNYHPSPGQPVEIYDNANGLIFGGMIETPEEENPLFTNLLNLPVSCVDNQALADRHLIAESYDNTLCGDIVRDMLTKKLSQDGVIAGVIHDGPTVSRAVFPYLSVSSALDELAELAGYSWWITHDKKLNFVARETFKSPWDITDTSPIRNLTVKKDKSQYRNRQYIRAGQDITDIQTERFKGDGEQQTYTIGFKLAKVPTLKVNGVIQTVGIRGVDDGKQWYWNKNEKEITQDRTGTPLTSSDTLEIEYYGYFPILVVADDTTSINERKSVEGGSGIYESIEEQASIDSADAALDIARGKLRKFARINRSITFETDKTGLQAGQIITVDLPIHNVSNAEFLIEAVSISEFTPEGDLRYRVTAVDGESVGGWTTFFKRLAHMGGTFTIRENEVLVKLKTMTDRVSVSDTLTVSKASPQSRVGFAMIGFSEIG